MSDRVLADLRGFREYNAGCRFELEQPLARPKTPCACSCAA
jgi:hypothetical protein